MRIAIASDHAGWKAKETLKKFLVRVGHKVRDFGTSSEDSVDYPDFGEKVARRVATRNFRYGILLCGSGLGMSMVANKIKGIRAVVCHNKFTAQMARAHNDANILCLGARILTIPRMKDIIRVWLKTSFEGGRHQRRVNKIRWIENRMK